MRKGEDTGLLRQIVRIRDAQRIVAEAAATRAATALHDAEQLRLDREQEIQSVEEGWLASLSAWDMTALWSAALVRQEAAVRDANASVAAAAAELDRRTVNLHVATVRGDVARNMARNAEARGIRRREEAVLQNAADRHVQRRHSL